MGLVKYMEYTKSSSFKTLKHFFIFWSNDQLKFGPVIGIYIFFSLYFFFIFFLIFIFTWIDNFNAQHKFFCLSRTTFLQDKHQFLSLIVIFLLYLPTHMNTNEDNYTSAHKHEIASPLIL